MYHLWRNIRPTKIFTFRYFNDTFSYLLVSGFRPKIPWSYQFKHFKIITTRLWIRIVWRVHYQSLSQQTCDRSRKHWALHRQSEQDGENFFGCIVVLPYVVHPTHCCKLAMRPSRLIFNIRIFLITLCPCPYPRVVLPVSPLKTQYSALEISKFFLDGEQTTIFHPKPI